MKAKFADVVSRLDTFVAGIKKLEESLADLKKAGAPVSPDQLNELFAQVVGISAEIDADGHYADGVDGDGYTYADGTRGADGTRHYADGPSNHPGTAFDANGNAIDGGPVDSRSDFEGARIRRENEQRVEDRDARFKDEKDRGDNAQVTRENRSGYWDRGPSDLRSNEQVAADQAVIDDRAATTANEQTLQEKEAAAKLAAEKAAAATKKVK